MFTEVAIEHGTAFAFTFLANTTIFTLWVTFLIMEIFSFLHNHVTALDNGTQVGVHFELKDDEVSTRCCRDHLLWKSNLHGLISDFSTTWEKVALHAYWRDRNISLGIVADFNCAVTLLGSSLSTPLDVVLRTLSC